MQQDDSASRLQAFKQRLRTEQQVRVFKSPEDLQAQVAATLEAHLKQAATGNQAEPVSQTDYLLTTSAQLGLGYAARFAMKESGTLRSVYSVLLLAGFLARAEMTGGLRNTSQFVLQYLRDHRRGRSASETTPESVINLLGLGPDYEISHLPEQGEGINWESPFFDEARSVLDVAADYAKKTSHVTPPLPNQVHTRHLMAALLTGAGSTGPFAVQALLTGLSYDLNDLRQKLCAFIETESAARNDDKEAWRQILLAPSEPLSEALQDLPLAGYIADALENDDHTEIKDQLDIADEVNALCAVIMAESVKPPLSLGLFGDWGTGKSFFMNKMRKRIDELEAGSARAVAEGKPTAFCSNVVQIPFNAWHYIDDNLWASLVSRIFDGLCDELTDVTTKPVVDREELFKRLQSSKEFLDEAERKKKLAETVRVEAQDRLEDLQTQRQQAEQSLKEVHASDALESVLAREDVKGRLTEAAKKLGIPEAEKSTGELIDLAKNLRSFGNRLPVFRQWLVAGPGRGKRIALLALLLLLPALIIYAIDQWGSSALSQSLAAKASVLIVALSGLTERLKSWYGKAKALMSELERAKEKTEQIAAQQQQQHKLEEEALAQQIGKLREDELAAQREYYEAKQKILNLEEEIRDIQAGRRLRKFIRERVDSSDYRKYAGIISLIRNDFDKLSGLLREASDEKRGPGLPRIDRIILYIDDLDRCPADRVVEVLQAVHLLLAFPLFVVVVGVDSRWMLQALKKHYAEFLGYSGAESGFADGDMSSWTSTPHNYLEKIFQIPFTLRRMDPKGFEGLVQSLLPVRAQTPSQTHSGSSAPPPPPGQAHQAALPPPPQGQATPPTPPQQPGQTPPPAPQQQAQTPPALPASRINMMPPNLAIEPWELEDIQKLSSMISSPRAAKRFVNIYRLIRASLKTRELAAFVGSKESRGEYQVVLILLSILTRFPNKASEIYVHLLKRQETDWRQLLDGLKPQPTGTGYRNVVDAAIDSNELPIWQTVYEGLTRISESLNMRYPIERFAYWTPRVARFSFQSGRVIAAFGADSQNGQKTAAPA